MKIALALALLVTAATACDVRCQWAAWKAKYGKVYTAAEEEHRFGVFQSKLEEIARLSAEMPLAEFGTNEFSDLTTAEFLSTRARLDAAAPRTPQEDPVVPDRIKRAVDYNSDYMTTATPAQNQAQCGSCWAFASAGVVEGAYKLATGQTVRLAPQQLVDCSTSASGCNGGNYDSGIGWWKSQTDSGNGGAANETQYPYTSAAGTAGTTCKTNKGWLGVKSYGSVKFNEAVGSGIDTTLVQYGPLGIALDATTLQSYKSGVLSTTSSCQSGVNHAVLLVGWATVSGTQVWIVKNSWGSTWGVTPPAALWSASNGGGFFYLKRGAGTCLVNSWGGYYATVAASSGGNACAAKTKAQACGTMTCGTASNGCGGTISCGTCSAGSSCTSAGACKADPVVVVSSTPAPVVSSSYTAPTTSSSATPAPTPSTLSGWESSTYFTASGNTLAVTADNAEHKLKWTSSVGVTSTSYTSFGAQVTLAAKGTVGIGMRLGQTKYPNANLVWKVTYDGASTATMYKCYTITSESCASVATWAFTPSATTTHNFTVSFQDSNGNVAMTPYWDNAGVYNKVLNAYGFTTYSMGPLSNWPAAGYAFVVGTASVKNAQTFTSPKIQTRSAVTLQLSSCHSESQIRAYAAQLLAVPADTISTSGSGSACSVDGASGFKSFGIVLSDTDKTQMLGFGAPVHTVTGGMQYSGDLASRLQNLLTSGGAEEMGYSVTSATASAVPIAAGAVVITESIATAGLSTGAVVGIAVGCSVGGLLLIGGAGAAVYAATRGGDAVEVPDDFQPRNPLRKTMYKLKARRGVDVVNMKKDDHQSITGRAPPIA